MKNKLREFFSTSNKDGKKHLSKKTGTLLIIGLAGLLFIILGNMFANTPEDPIDENLAMPQEQEHTRAARNDSSLTKDVAELEASYKQELEEMLEKIKGVSEVEVMVNLDSTNISVYEKNLIAGTQTTDENDKNGGTRQIEDQTEETQVVLVRQGDKETPLLVHTKKPEVRGVFIVAKGVDHATVKKWVVEATARVLDVPTHRVSVMPKN